MKLTIIAGTNRQGSYTLKVAKIYQQLLLEKGISAHLLSLEGIDVMNRNAAFEKIENEIIIPSDIFLFVSPEYNGSFPGVLKMLFDTGKTHALWWHKKAMLVGVSTGRAGNLRGMDHLTAVLNHIKVTVHPNQLPISSIDKLMDGNENFIDENTLQAIHHQIDELVKWM